ncbi:MAG: glycosyltransferase family 2 protein [Lachnospiraceae bacterium]|nr:glycosyltransferase family 2 protein [Lachnospiraceae bacterium]
MAAISVIIPCYNVSSYIDRCLTSITSQTIDLSLLEIICIDDASTDDTWQKLQTWEAKYPDNIMIIQCKENGRQGKARNIGLSYASANWIAFIDSDDWIERDYFQKMYAAACSTAADLITCGNVRDFSYQLQYRHDNNYDYSKDAVCGKYITIDSEEKKKLYIRMMSSDLTAWGKLIKKDILLDNEIFFPEGLAYEDNYWGTLLHFYVNKIYEIDLPLYHYFVNEKSTILSMNADYHEDFLTVQLLKWNTFLERGFFEQYSEEIIFDFLHACYLDYLKIICLRFDPPSFSRFLLLKEIILTHIPNYSHNKYFEQGFTEFQHMLIDMLRLPVNKDQFLEISGYIKLHGI